MLAPRSVAAFAHVCVREFRYAVHTLDCIWHARRDKRRGWGLPPT